MVAGLEKEVRKEGGREEKLERRCILNTPHKNDSHLPPPSLPLSLPPPQALLPTHFSPSLFLLHPSLFLSTPPEEVNTQGCASLSLALSLCQVEGGMEERWWEEGGGRELLMMLLQVRREGGREGGRGLLSLALSFCQTEGGMEERWSEEGGGRELLMTLLQVGREGGREGRREGRKEGRKVNHSSPFLTLEYTHVTGTLPPSRLRCPRPSDPLGGSTGTPPSLPPSLPPVLPPLDLMHI